MVSDAALLTSTLGILLGLTAIAGALGVGFGTLAYSTNPDQDDGIMGVPVIYGAWPAVLGIILVGVVLAVRWKSKD